MKKHDKFCRRIICIILSVSMIICTSPVYANTDDCSNNHGKIVKTSIDEILINELSSLSEDDVVVDGENDILKIYYTLENGKQGFAEKRIQGGSEIYYFKEGDIENTIVKTSEGKYYLDGEEVFISINNKKSDNSFENYEYQEYNIDGTRGKHYNVTSYYDTVPSGTNSSEYSVYVREDEINVDFNKTVQSLTAGALITLLSGGLLAIAEAGYIVGTLVSLATGTFTTVISLLQSNHPLSKGSKIKLTRYKRSNGYMIPSVITGEVRYAYKDRLKYYAKKTNGSYVWFDTDYRYRLTRIYS